MSKKQLKTAQKTPKNSLSEVLKEAKNAIKIADSLDEAYTGPVKAAAPGGQSARLDKLVTKSLQNIAKRKEDKRKERKEQEERLVRIKAIRKRIEDAKKEQVQAAEAAKKETIQALTKKIEDTEERVARAKRKGKQVPGTERTLKQLKNKFKFLTKEKSTTRPLEELERKLKQIESIVSAEARLAAYDKQIQQWIDDNREGGTHPEDQIMRAEQVSDSMHQKISNGYDKIEAYMQDDFEETSRELKLSDWIPATAQATPYWEKPPEAAAEPKTEPSDAKSIFGDEPNPSDVESVLGELRKYVYGKLKRQGSTLRVLDKGLGFNIRKFANDSELLSRWVKEDDGSYGFIDNIFDFLINKGFFVRNPSNPNSDWVIWDKGIDEYLELLKKYGLGPWVWDSSELTSQPGAAAEPEAGAEKSPKEQALENVSKIEDPSLRKFAFINNFLSGNNGAPLTEELAYSTGRYERRYGNDFRAQLQDILKYLRSLQQQAEKMLGEAPQGLSSSNLGTNPRLKQLAPELSEENLDAANKIYRDLWMENVVSYKDLVATVVHLHIKGALRDKNPRAFINDNVSKYAENPMLLKQYEQKQRPQANESKKTISDITDQLMEQLYDTLN